MSAERGLTGAGTPGAGNVPLPAVQQRAGLAATEDLAAFQIRFLRLLERRAAIYTMGDSTSLPTHVAADLLRSVSFVLGVDPDNPEVPESLLSVDLEGEYRRRLAEIGRRVERAERLWRDVVATMPLIENIALRDTLKEIGSFFKRYDYRSMAHEILCSIDYPLCQPVPESLQGIDYIEEYLRRLMIEAQFLALFEVAACERLLRAYSPDPVELLINLYEPIATNAIGLGILGKDPRTLSISDEDRAEMECRLSELPRGRRDKALRDAALMVCGRLGLTDEAGQGYLVAFTGELTPRIGVGLAHAGLAGVFISA